MFYTGDFTGIMLAAHRFINAMTGAIDEGELEMGKRNRNKHKNNGGGQTSVVTPPSSTEKTKTAYKAHVSRPVKTEGERRQDATNFAIKLVREYKSGGSIPEKQLMAMIVDGLVRDHAPGTLDAHKLAEAFWQQRPSGADRDQTRDYVLYLLRESDHVCRHNLEEGIYRFHQAAACHLGCRDKHKQTAPENKPKAQYSGCCHLTITPLGTCSGCGDDCYTQNAELINPAAS